MNNLDIFSSNDRKKDENSFVKTATPICYPLPTNLSIPYQDMILNIDVGG